MTWTDAMILIGAVCALAGLGLFRSIVREVERETTDHGGPQNG